MIYAQILGDVVKNTIVLEDTTLESLFAEGFDLLMRVDNVTPQPSIGWTWNGTTFSPPIIPNSVLVPNTIMPNAVTFANKLQADFISWNILNGITQLNKTDAVLSVMTMKVTLSSAPEPVSLMDTLNAICPSLSTAVNVLQYHIDNISNYSSLSPFITAARLQTMQASIKAYLGM